MERGHGGAAVTPAPALAGFDVAHDVPASSLTTWRVGGPIRTLVRVGSRGELLRLSEALHADDGPFLVIGRGSNLLVADAGFDGVALALGGELEEIDLDRGRATHQVVAGGGASLPVVARRSAARGLRGLEFYVGIPGSVGGAVRMNAGGHGSDTAGVLVAADVLTIGEPTFARCRPQALGLGFRRSSLGPRDVVVDATFAVGPDDPARCADRVEEIVRWRREHQPGGSNAGSVFVNPLPLAAAELIDGCGLKGRRVGGAVVSPRHANFIQSEPGATAADIVDLIAEVQQVVLERTGVALVTEVRMVGFDGPRSARARVRP